MLLICPRPHLPRLCLSCLDTLLSLSEWLVHVISDRPIRVMLLFGCMSIRVQSPNVFRTIGYSLNIFWEMPQTLYNWRKLSLTVSITPHDEFINKKQLFIQQNSKIFEGKKHLLKNLLESKCLCNVGLGGLANGKPIVFSSGYWGSPRSALLLKRPPLNSLKASAQALLIP